MVTSVSVRESFLQTLVWNILFQFLAPALAFFHPVNDSCWYAGSRNLTESQRAFCKHSFLVSVSENQKAVAVLWLCCHSDGNRRVDGGSLTACTHHRCCGLVSFANALYGYCGIVFNFQQRPRKRSLSPVCLTAGHLHYTEGSVT